MSMKLLLTFIFLVALVQNSDAQTGRYCVANEEASENQMREAINWACSNGANCTMLQPNQPCYLPNNLRDHASYAFNSYYQSRKAVGGTCNFNSAAHLTDVNPSHGACKFD